MGERLFSKKKAEIRLKPQLKRKLSDSIFSFECCVASLATKVKTELNKKKIVS